MPDTEQNKTLHILLADDDIDDCHFFKGALDKLPMPTVLTAVHDGEQLMQLLTIPVNELPDILFLDLNMPRKNGFECLTEIKLNGQLAQLPIIIFSTSYEEEVVNTLYKNGARHFVRKPSEFSEFKNIIHQTLVLVARKGTTRPDRAHFVLTVENSKDI